MIELLALPQWNAPARTLAEWSARLAEAGHPARVTRDGSDAAWLDLPSLEVRGYAVIEGAHVSAINFELHAADPDRAAQALDAVSQGLGWEVHTDDDEDDDEDDPDNDD